jgi:nucleoside-diphosphate-sugar epimerase
MKRVLVTGATGFVGRQLCELLSERGYRVRAALRTDRSFPIVVAESVVVGDIGANTDWAAALDGVECVVHCAALAHIIGDQRGLSNRYMECNARGTENLMQASVDAGVRRFVYLSSIKVNGEKSVKSPFSRLDTPNPGDDYAMSKWRAETRVVEIAGISSTEAAIVRPPLVYGPEVRANFLRLMRWVDSRVPLPLGLVENSRSLVSIWNLCDLVERLLRDSIPRNAVFMVSDGEDLSTTELIRRIGLAMDRPVKLIPVPVSVLRVLGALSGRKAEIERLCGTLTVDIASTCSELRWRPPISVDEGLARTARWYFSRSQRV